MKTVFADLDQILFESREKSYGAYELRKNYQRRLMRALLIGLLLFVTVTAFPRIVRWMNAGPLTEPETEIIPIDVGNILPPPPSIEEEEAPPPPPKIKTPPPVKTIEFKVPDPKPEDEVEKDETIEEMDKIEDSNPDLETKDGADVGNYNWDDGELGGSLDEAFIEKEEPKEIGPNEFVLLEKEPTPVNMDDLKKMIGYPAMAKEAEIEGKVVLRVQVDKNGNYVKHIIMRDPHPLLTSEVIKNIRQLKFTPGIQAGKPIKVWVTIPFDFKLLR